MPFDLNNKCEQICRVCRTWSDKNIPIYNNLCVNNVQLQVAEMLVECTALQVNLDDGLPSTLCELCVNNLIEFFKFKRDSETSFNYFTNFKTLLQSKQCKNFTVKEEENPDKIVMCRPFDCNYCSGSFSNYNLLKKHRQYHIYKQKEILRKCCYCSYEFESDESLNYHKRIHESQQTYFCRRCSFTIVQESMVQHLREFHAEIAVDAKYFECFIPMDLKNNFRTHIISEEKLSDEISGGLDSKIVNNLSSIDPAPDLCERQCSEKEEKSDFPVTTSNDDLLIQEKLPSDRQKRNVPKLVQSTKKVSKTSPTMFKCKVCSKTFTSKSYRNKHEKGHEKRDFKCPDCGKSYTTNSHLNEHLKSHSESVTHLCNQCGKPFSKKSNLDVHIRRHLGVKPFKCQFCDKSFARDADLRVHVLAHTGEKKHLCLVCGKRFSRTDKLTRHMRVHTGEKPHKCKFKHCNAAFAQSYDLVIHTRRHTGQRLKCDVCNNTFLQLYALKQHKQIQHGIHFKRLPIYVIKTEK